MSASTKAYYQKHKEEIKARTRAYKAARREHYNALQRDWAKANPVAAKAIEIRTRNKNIVKKRTANKEWYLKNADRIKSKMKARYANDPEYRAAVLAACKAPEIKEKIRARNRTPKYRARFNARRNKRLSEDLNFKIRSRLGSRLSNAMRLGRGVKSAATMELIGCTIEFLKRHLERQFAPGMSWEAFNHGDIHIDHIKACVKFDMTDPVEQRRCFHYSNLQPLWGPDNLSKHDK